MKRFIAPAAIVAALVLAVPSQAARAPTNRQLAKQIKTLRAQVTALQKQVREARLVALGALAYSGCSVAVTADAFQGTWATIDDVSNRANPPRAIYGPQQAVNDFGVCNAFRITRAPTQVPPTTAVFNSLLILFRP